MPVLAFDTAAKIRRAIYMRAYVLSVDGGRANVADVRLKGSCKFISRFSLSPSPSDPRSPMLEFYAIGDDEFNFGDITLEVDIITVGRKETVVCTQEIINRNFLRPQYTVVDTWTRLMEDSSIRHVLDIGGRARSGISRKDMLPGKQIRVADILAAPEVDYVADVHELSSQLKEKFDAFMSIATFEHLLMPWKAAIEINKVLKDGGVGLVVTHQAIGIHDVPWDYFRYSDNAWKGIFNAHTGFEIVDAGMMDPAMIIPRHWSAAHEGTEHAVGYMTSSVVVRKISQPRLDWPVPIAAITDDRYPE